MRSCRFPGLAVAILLVGLLGLMGCSNGNTPAGQGTAGVKAVCTTGMVADLVRQVGGSHVAVDQLMGEGVDPHLYKAAPGDISKLNAADVIFYSGLSLEGKMANAFASQARKKAVYAVSEGIPDNLILQEGEHPDPHVWHDVSLWSHAVGFVGEELAKYDPKHADEYGKNATAYQAELAELHEECKQKLAVIPKDRRVLVTAHDAFEYFGRAYEIEVKAIQGISTEDEAGLKQINDLVDFITKRRIKAVFVETSVNERNIRSLVEGCKARGHEVTIGGSLYSDALGKEGTPEGTYAGMIRHNVNTIVNALK